MNRRKFFGMSVAAVTLAGLPEIVLPQKTIFLPPKHGWHPAQLSNGSMRESRQYLINTDSEMWRYDAIGRDIWGKEYQFHVDFRHDVPETQRIEMASLMIADQFQRDGLAALKIGESREFLLRLSPYGGRRYV